MSSERTTYAKRMVCACSGAILTSLCTTPLDVLKTRMQVGVHVATNSLSATASALLRREGFWSFWSGLTPSLMMQVPSTVLYFTLYDELRGRLEARGALDTLAILAPMISGTVSRSVVGTLMAPLELVRTRAMALDGEQGVVRALRAEIAAGGVGTLWRGLGPTLARDVPFSAIYWFGYEQLKSMLLGFRGVRGVGASDSMAAGSGVVTGMHSKGLGSYWLSSFSCGVISGVVAAALTTPQDVVKTRRQVASNAGVSMRLMMGRIYAEEGLKGLFSGVSMRCARVGPACGIMIGSYEVGKKYLGI